MIAVPNIVYYQQDVVIGQFLGETRRGFVQGLKGGWLISQHTIQSIQNGQQVWVLAQCHPQHTFVKGLLHVLVMTQGSRQRSLTEATCPDQRSCDRDRIIACLITQLRLEGLEHLGALHEMLRQIRHTVEGDPQRMTGRLQVVNEGLPLVIEIIEVTVAHPLRQRGKVDGQSRHLHRIDTYTLLAGIAPLLAHDGRRYRLWCGDQHHEGNCIERVGDLLPPTDAAFHVSTVLPQGQPFRFQTTAKLSGKILAILARVGDKHAGLIHNAAYLKSGVRHDIG